MTELYVEEKASGMATLTVGDQNFGNVEYEISLKRPATREEMIAYYILKINCSCLKYPRKCESCVFHSKCPITNSAIYTAYNVIGHNTFIEE